MGFTFEPLSPLTNVVLISPDCYRDDRGCFIEAYKAPVFTEVGITDHFVQDNLSVSHYGVLRGLHYQKSPYQQAKLVRCVQGAIWDVAVDIRPESATFGQWVGATLTADTMQMLYIPAGFAHGFLVLSETATVHYKASCVYQPDSDAGIAWNDADLAIDWPSTDRLIVSAKDQNLPSLKQVFSQTLLPA